MVSTKATHVPSTLSREELRGIADAAESAFKELDVRVQTINRDHRRQAVEKGRLVEKDRLTKRRSD